MTYIIRGDASAGSLGIGNPNYLSVVALMTAATWNTATVHEVFTVTGLVRMRMWIECTATLTDAADAARIQFGHEAATNAFIAVTAGATAGAALIATGVLWYDATPDLLPSAPSASIMDYVINNYDVGYEITGAAMTGGSLTFHCVWEPLNATGNVTAGAGGAMV